MNIKEMIDILENEEDKTRELVLFDYDERREVSTKFYSLRLGCTRHANTKNLLVLISNNEIEPIR